MCDHEDKQLVPAKWPHNGTYVYHCYKCGREFPCEVEA